ncbi:hypothetical protein EVAR_88997_1 [Eumeta japonica]|uniref:Uncharacterized protein n=1 Tax=Eumeta variegata TaxID=151549 RepID=A0A4C1X801_EUMVA|nr:hypothetical protein EVAR_88997_1 [Eumeta japonica]
MGNNRKVLMEKHDLSTTHPITTNFLRNLPNSNTIKQELTNWLNRHEIPVEPKLTKSLRYDIICQDKERFTEFPVDKVLIEYGRKTDGEGDIDDDEAIDWSNSDEENENIDDNDEN